jgi:hypothetical protein
MNYLASYITCVLLICSIQNSVADNKIKQDAEKYLGTIKAKKVSEQILSAPFAKECAQVNQVVEGQNGLEFGDDPNNVKRGEYEKCIATAIDKISNEDIKKVSNKMNLKAYDKEAAKSTTSIKEYLQKRLHKAITGIDPDDKEPQIKSFDDKRILAHEKVVDHGIFYQLYAEQIGKNSILQVSRYCLENFGGSKPQQMYFGGNKDRFINLLKYPNTGTAFDKFEQIEPDSDAITTNLGDYVKTPPKSMSIGIWSSTVNHDGDSKTPKVREVNEYEICTLPTKIQCDKKFEVLATTRSAYIKKYRHINIVEAIKNAEFLSAEVTRKTEIISDRYGYCVSLIIPQMCNLYKCNNVYDENSDPKDILNCKNMFRIDVSTGGKESTSGLVKDSNGNLSLNVSSTQDKSTGSIACNVQNRLKEYKLVLTQIKELQADLKKGKTTGSSIDYLQARLRQRGKGKDDINIGEMTTISSKEIGEGVSEFKDGEDNAKELSEKCMNPTTHELLPGADKMDECKSLFATIDKEGLDNINLAEQAQAALKLKEIASVEGRKELEEFLKRNNLSEYIKKGDLTYEDIDLLKVKVAQEFKAKKMALVASLQEKFNTEAKLTKENSNATGVDPNIAFEGQIAQQSISDIKEHKKRVETLLQYSNIVSSYLVFKDKDDNDVGSNVVGLNAEMNNKKDDDKYLKYFSAESSESGYGNVDYLQFIDGVIGNIKEEEKPAN